MAISTPQRREVLGHITFCCGAALSKHDAYKGCGILKYQW